MDCAVCHAPLNREDRFCGECGHPVETGTTVDVILTAVGANKIQVIKAVRDLTGLGLKDAKDLVEGAPSPIMTNVTAEKAERIRATLEALGASVRAS